MQTPHITSVTRTLSNPSHPVDIVLVIIACGSLHLYILCVYPRIIELISSDLMLHISGMVMFVLLHLGLSTLQYVRVIHRQHS